MKRLTKVITLSLLIPTFVFAASKETEEPKSTSQKSWTCYLTFPNAIRIVAGATALVGLGMMGKTLPPICNAMDTIEKMARDMKDELKSQGMSSPTPEELRAYLSKKAFFLAALDDYDQERPMLVKAIGLTLLGGIGIGVNEYYNYNSKVEIKPYFG